ncbi:hypothetical protein Lepto7375DRAFT_3302 [Leptolyngbya sp. PCC 7375]|nr:hypothetical protein Lepto7375DRAFT_3302 [Leptolyngbya sp. PCC 7375]
MASKWLNWLQYNVGVIYSSDDGLIQDEIY